ncbi:hypothetical protein F2Q68_00014766 [Brassica cretica]|uniref:Uncharacterized protein n=1 Tax=Brassica cretica TaxID=69181 RepID=A0A8S9HNF6_BRACR|nr:hypothetical protein F2Q68_00014766 [Brassica cretica]
MAASSSSKSGHEIPEKEIKEDIRPSSGGFPTEGQASLNHIHLTSSNLTSFLFYYSSETRIDNDIRPSSAFYQTLRDSSWKIIDAGETMEEVEKKIQQVVLDKVKECAQVKSLSLL